MSTSGKPTPVIAALQMPSSKQFGPIRDALNSVDSVHLDGSLPPVRVVRGIGPHGENGHFNLRRLEILIADNARNPKATMLHETGHLLDLMGIGTSRVYASAFDPRLAGWRLSVLQSRAYRDWKTMATSSSDPHLRDYVNDYHLKVSELWARSYAQYVAMRSGDVFTLQALITNVDPLPGGQVLHYQWSAADFDQIASAFDDLMLQLGWIP